MNFNADAVVLVEIFLRYAVERRLNVFRENFLRILGEIKPFSRRRGIEPSVRAVRVDLGVVRIALVNVLGRAVLEPCETVVDRRRVVREGVRDIVERLIFRRNRSL